MLTFRSLQKLISDGCKLFILNHFCFCYVFSMASIQKKAFRPGPFRKFSLSRADYSKVVHEMDSFLQGK